MEEVASIEFKENIKREFIQPTFTKDIKGYIKDRFLCRKYGYRFELTGKILTGVATVCAFLSAGVSGYERAGALVSGGIGMIAVLCQNIATFSLKRSRESTENLNHTLQSLKIDVIIPNEIKPPVVHE